MIQKKFTRQTPKYESLLNNVKEIHAKYGTINEFQIKVSNNAKKCKRITENVHTSTSTKIFVVAIVCVYPRISTYLVQSLHKSANAVRAHKPLLFPQRTRWRAPLDLSLNCCLHECVSLDCGEDHHNDQFSWLWLAKRGEKKDLSWCLEWYVFYNIIIEV